MRFLGLTLSELAALFAIAAALSAFIRWCFKKGVDAIDRQLVQPLTITLDKLSNRLEGFESKAEVEHADFKKQLIDHDDRLDGHELKLTEHEQKILTLFKQRSDK